MKLFKNFFSTSNLPKFNLFIGLTGFGFQIMVLNPWHYQLSKQFKQLHLEIKSIGNSIGNSIDNNKK